MNRGFTGVLATVLPFAAILSAVGLQGVLASRPRPDINDVLYLPNPATAKYLDLGLGEAWADWMHIQALLYVVQDFDLDMADKEAARAAVARGELPPPVPPKYVWLSQLYDAITELDPDFDEAYLYGARFLSLLRRGEEGRATGGRLAVTLLQKATANPRLAKDWRIWNELAMTYYLDLNDLEHALEAMEAATALPDCPALVVGFAARISEGTDRDMAILENLNERIEAARKAGDAFMVRAVTERRDQHAARILERRLQSAADALREAGSTPDLAALRRQVIATTGWNPGIFEEAGGFWYDAAANVVESKALGPPEEDRRRRNLMIEVERYRLRHGQRPATLADIPRDPEAELRAVHHHPFEGWRWVYDPSTGEVRSERAP